MRGRARANDRPLDSHLCKGVTLCGATFAVLHESVDGPRLLVVHRSMADATEGLADIASGKGA